MSTYKVNLAEIGRLRFQSRAGQIGAAIGLPLL